MLVSIGIGLGGKGGGSDHIDSEARNHLFGVNRVVLLLFSNDQLVHTYVHQSVHAFQLSGSEGRTGDGANALPGFTFRVEQILIP